ncbi:MAG: hypothetical protein ABSA66_21245, partial [Roseiarcus sp.]
MAGVDGAVCRREAALFVVVVIILPEPTLCRLPALRRQPQVGARLLARLDAGGDEDVQRLRLLQRIDRVVADPNEFEIGLVQVDL